MDKLPARTARQAGPCRIEMDVAAMNSKFRYVLMACIFLVGFAGPIEFPYYLVMGLFALTALIIVIDHNITGRPVLELRQTLERLASFVLGVISGIVVSELRAANSDIAMLIL